MIYTAKKNTLNFDVLNVPSITSGKLHVDNNTYKEYIESKTVAKSGESLNKKEPMSPKVIILRNNKKKTVFVLYKIFMLLIQEKRRFLTSKMMIGPFSKKLSKGYTLIKRHTIISIMDTIIKTNKKHSHIR